MRKGLRIDPHHLGTQFWEKVNLLAPGGCWEWVASTNSNGYGRMWMEGKLFQAHRLSLAAETGIPLDTELYALHSCDNPPCVNPDHLRWGTQAENAKDMVTRDRMSKDRAAPPRSTRCRRGHALIEGNIYLRPNGARRCRTCALLQNKEWRGRRGANASPE